MLIIERSGKDPYFNVAAEEYLLKTINADCFMLWQNDPSIIVGKHQNALAEINLPFILDKKIPVIRRISGGGTVYHDHGNINFSFIKTGERDKLVDFRKFLDPVIGALNQLGIPAKFEGKNDLRVNGLKISGNAEHVYRNKVLHHGTLLYSSDLTIIKQVFNNNPEKFADKAVRSLRSNVANITDFIAEPLHVNEFMQKITAYIEKNSGTIDIIGLKTNDIIEINKLVTEKYGTWQWNFGYSPPYIFRNEVETDQDTFNIELHVKDGMINNPELKINGKISGINNIFEYLLNGKKHEFHTLQALVLSNSLFLESNNFSPNILLRLLF
jgi:lipoate-protein ligase A